MRGFSDFEKKILRRIVSIHPENSNVGTFIADIILSERGIEVDEKGKTISLWYLKIDTNAISEFFELISLLTYLEKNDLIFIHSNPEKALGAGGFLTKNITQDYLNTKKDLLDKMPIPTDVYDQIVRYIRSYLICGTEIKILVANDFKTQEQKAHDAEMKEAISQTKLSKLSLYVAFIALGFSFLTPLIFDTTINRTQIEKINSDNQTLIENLIDIKNLLRSKADSISQQAHAPNSGDNNH